ncbi:hypothetical protein [Psychrosphaera haliotis]|uniref:DUF3187 family protein n=1 Tax=Psychrosphaera haliotis TaxID=555083 RepID=A0A6N8F987_9GAMM|nr:hypothetical protein [Psychrosphaera haliotis]MUH72724.1 hypothetical protein [Psychrosphaera haliotis]
MKKGLIKYISTLTIIVVSNSVFAETEPTQFKEKFLTMSLDYYYSSWTPTGIDGVDYQTIELNVAVAELNFEASIAKVNNKIGFQLPIPKTIKYMWTPEQDAQQAFLLQSNESATGDEALEKLFVDLPLYKFSDTTELQFQYDKGTFLSSLTLEEDKQYLEFGGSETTILEGSVLNQQTDFEKFTGLAEFNFGDNVYLAGGLFAIQYKKPYSLTIDGITDSQKIYDTKFEAQGFAFQFKSELVNTNDFKVRIKVLMHYGPGDIKFSDTELLADNFEDFEDTALIFITSHISGEAAITGNLHWDFYLGYDYYDFHKAQVGPDGSISSSKFAGQLDLNIDSVFYAGTGLKYYF